jgi:hypothetical protein
MWMARARQARDATYRILVLTAFSYQTTEKELFEVLLETFDAVPNIVEMESQQGCSIQRYPA